MKKKNGNLNYNGKNYTFSYKKNDKSFYPICQVKLSQFKVSNLKRHYETNHSTFSREFPIGFQNKLKLFIRDLQSNNFTHFSCLKKIEACLTELEIKINCDDYVLKLEFLFTDFKERFRDLKTLKPSFGFLENPFLVNVIEKRCPLSHPIVTNKADLEIELFELLEDEGLKQFTNNCPSILEFWKHISILKYPNIKNCAVKLI